MQNHVLDLCDSISVVEAVRSGETTSEDKISPTPSSVLAFRPKEGERFWQVEDDDVEVSINSSKPVQSVSCFQSDAGQQLVFNWRNTKRYKILEDFRLI